MWFRNFFVYQLPEAAALDAVELHQSLKSKAFKPCAKDQREVIGFVPPIADTESLTHEVDGNILLSMAHQERLLPSSVIKEILDERIEEIKIREARKVSGREKKDMREQVEFELLPRAFTRTRQLDAWIDTKKGWIVLNTSSTVQAERFTGLMRKVLDSFPVAAPDTDQSPTFVMSNWLSEGVLPAPFELGEGCELCSQGDDRSVATFKKHELLSDVVQSNLGAGKLCSKLSLVWNNQLSFTMTESLLIKGVKFLDVFKEQVNDQDPQTQAECKDIEFALMTGAFRNLFADISKAFEVSEPAGKE